jgi:four helix bundle protein
MVQRNYQDLLAWQRGMALVEEVYRVTRRLPQEELYGLTSQMRRAAVAVPSNIAEGEGRNTQPDFLRFLGIAHGSIRELETQLLICRKLAYLTEEEAVRSLSLCAETGRMLNGLMNSLRR